MILTSAGRPIDRSLAESLFDRGPQNRHDPAHDQSRGDERGREDPWGVAVVVAVEAERTPVVRAHLPEGRAPHTPAFPMADLDTRIEHYAPAGAVHVKRDLGFLEVQEVAGVEAADGIEGHRAETACSSPRSSPRR